MKTIIACLLSAALAAGIVFQCGRYYGARRALALYREGVRYGVRYGSIVAEREEHAAA
jgi:hypothetical protein